MRDGFCAKGTLAAQRDEAPVHGVRVRDAAVPLTGVSR